jgi:trehalose synthase
MSTPDPGTIAWLQAQSMLLRVQSLARRYSGQGALWQHPYAETQPRAASALASVWFTAYPASIITRPGVSVLATLGDENLWRALATIGVKAVHTGPMKLSGGVRGRDLTPTVDGNFDRISLDIDPQFGSEAEYVALSRTAAAHGAIVIDDIIPGHTGKGPDFRLAEYNVGDYPGLYHMVEIAREDWTLLPAVPTGDDAVNLPPATVDLLQAKGYIVGRLRRTIFYEPGVKETDWSATDVVTGVDGVARRWVYLHYFKAGQPTLNWLDPSFAAPRLVLGDALHALDVLGASMLRLDANGFLGIERRPDGLAWSEGHPLSLIANQLIAGLVRKAGGFSFQELNLTVDDIAAMAHGGADLSYDFVTRPAYHHALVTGDTEFLRQMLNTVHAYGLDPAALIHALQNHDELTLELVHFWTAHAHDLYRLGGQTLTGSDLRLAIRATMVERLSGADAPYNLPFVTNGVACTTASLVAAALGIRDLDALTAEQEQQIQQAHLLLCMYNALQPGVFALSGWDLVGALPLPPAAVAHLMGDGDTRWIPRGAYDLMGIAPEAQSSAAGMPRARALYGALPDQLARPDSFARRLQTILAVRQRYRLYEARQIQVPDVQSKGLLVMVHELPEGLLRQVTILNFGPDPIEEVIPIPGAAGGVAVNLFTDLAEEVLSATGDLRVRLDGYAGKAYLIRSQP